MTTTTTTKTSLLLYFSQFSNTPSSILVALGIMNTLCLNKLVSLQDRRLYVQENYYIAPAWF